MKRIGFVISIIVLVGVVYAIYSPSATPEDIVVSNRVQEIISEKQNEREEENNTEQKSEIEVNEAQEVQEQEEDNNSEISKLVSIPTRMQLDVPFIVQAPNANWDLPYAEACEEASLLMVHHFYENQGPFSQDEMKSAIDDIIYWGDETFGAFDTSAETTTRYFTERLGYNADDISVLYDFTIQDMKALLAEGIPLIVPAAGRELGNKFFQNPGPLYHMLVITGYTEDQFIANDPGTRRGEGYKYNQEVLYNAIHDLTPNLEEIGTGRKAMIIVHPGIET